LQLYSGDTIHNVAPHLAAFDKRGDGRGVECEDAAAVAIEPIENEGIT
jgi:hypothetical protein